ncbi:MAG: hypothetical protein HQK64_04125 [Desulfamplus sp.]|nr:hypothetical protein [Desulfamplus sp.]
METALNLLYTGNNFSSKEITFMKSESDCVCHSDFAPPEQYLADILIKKDDDPLDSNSKVWSNFKEFTDKIFEQIGSRAFVCFVVKFESAIQKELQSQLNFESKYGFNLWQCLSESTLIVAILERDLALADAQILDLINFADSTLKIKSHAGRAIYPFLSFDEFEVMCNAVKALDHASFFEHGTLQFFDDVTQNIYGDRLYQLGMVDKAADEYKIGLKIKCDNLNLLNSLGVCYSLIGQLKLAKEQFERAIAYQRFIEYQNCDCDSYVDEFLFMLFYNAALTCDLTGDIKNGIEYIKEATAMGQQLFEVELTAGILMLKAGIKDGVLIDSALTDKALAHIQNAIKINPNSAVAHRILGEFYLQSKMPSKAVNEYKMALKLNPYDAIAMSGLARTFEIQNKNLDIALSLALNSLSIAPDNHLFRTRLAKIYLKKGKYEFADIEFSKAEQQFKESILHLNRGDCDKNSVNSSDLADGGLNLSEIVKDSDDTESLFDYDGDDKSEEEVFDKKSA